MDIKNKRRPYEPSFFYLSYQIPIIEKRSVRLFQHLLNIGFFVKSLA